MLTKEKLNEYIKKYNKSNKNYTIKLLMGLEQLKTFDKIIKEIARVKLKVK
jgi:hypothetical protein